MITVCFEGANGVGKTTQANLAVERFKKEFPRHNVRLLSDPGVCSGHPAHETLRPLARYGDWNSEMTRMMLYMAARCELIYEVNNAAAEDIIVLDRFAASYYAYGAETFWNSQVTALLAQGISSSSSLYTGIHNISNLLEICGAFTPDFTIVLSVPVDVAMARWQAVSGDNPDVFEQEGHERIEKLANFYRDILKNHKDFPYVGCQLFDSRSDGAMSAREFNDGIMNSLLPRMTQLLTSKVED